MENQNLGSENEKLEFKRSMAEKDSAGESLVAFANKDGGEILIGVENDGSVVGFQEVADETVQKLAQLFTDNTEPRLYPVIDTKDYQGKKVISIKVKKSSTPYHTFRSRGFIRVGTSDKRMTQEELHRRWMEYENTTFDFSAEICLGLTMNDLDSVALSKLREHWATKENDEEFLSFSYEELLEKLLLKQGNSLTYAALILCGTSKKIAEYLPEAEIRFGWKTKALELDFEFTKDWRHPFINIFESIWETINARNSRFPVEQGFFEGDVWAFDQKSIREALLNAVAHRDYQARGSIFIEATSDSFMVKSPGGFLPGISAENILDVQGRWRNRLLMEVLGKIGLVERYGHGLDRIFRKTISSGKGMPVIREYPSGTVELHIPTLVRDPHFIVFLEKVSKEKTIHLDFVKDLIFLEEIRQNQSTTDVERKRKFLDLQIIEKIGKGRGMKYLLSRHFYTFIGKKGEYTRKKWLSKDQQKATLWNFFRQHEKGKMKDFREDVFENKLSNAQILKLLTSLTAEGKIYFDGPQRSPIAFWKIKKTNKI